MATSSWRLAWFCSDFGNPVLWQPVFSPLEGTKMTVNNLHPRVTEEDIVVSTVQGVLDRAPPNYPRTPGWGSSET